MPSRPTRANSSAKGSLGRLSQSDRGLPRTDASVLACTSLRKAGFATSTAPSTSVTATPSLALSTSRASVAPRLADEPNCSVVLILTSSCCESITRNGVAVTLVLLTRPSNCARVSVDCPLANALAKVSLTMPRDCRSNPKVAFCPTTWLSDKSNNSDAL